MPAFIIYRSLIFLADTKQVIFCNLISFETFLLVFGCEIRICCTLMTVGLFNYDRTIPSANLILVSEIVKQLALRILQKDHGSTCEKVGKNKNRKKY